MLGILELEQLIGPAQRSYSIPTWYPARRQPTSIASEEQKHIGKHSLEDVQVDSKLQTRPNGLKFGLNEEINAQYLLDKLETETNIAHFY